MSATSFEDPFPKALLHGPGAMAATGDWGRERLVKYAPGELHCCWALSAAAASMGKLSKTVAGCKTPTFELYSIFQHCLSFTASFNIGI